MNAVIRVLIQRFALILRNDIKQGRGEIVNGGGKIFVVSPGAYRFYFRRDLI